MLTSLVVTFTPSAPAALPRDLGRAAHAVLLRQLGQQQPALAERLHNWQGPKPFTCSGVFGGARHEDQLLANPGDGLWLRYTALTAELSTALLAGPPPSHIDLAGTRMTVTGWTAEANAHARAANISYEALAAPYLLSRERAERRITLRFVSPTAFKSHGQVVTLPLPASVFGGLIEKWNTYAPIALPPETKRFAEACLAISRYRLRTAVLRGKGSGDEIARISGFVGEVSYVATNPDRYWLGLINLLSDFAFFAGVGYQTTQGMGQVRRVRD